LAAIKERPGLPGRKEDQVLRPKLRAGLLGLLAVLLLGSYAATPAFAEGGPFCHHSQNGVTDNGQIKAQQPENIQGQGGEQSLEGKLGGTEVKITAASAQLKGNLYNNEDQCQAKVEISYHELRIAGFPNCIVTLPNQNLVKLYYHQAWTWNGEAKQLAEKPQTAQERDWIVLPVELQQGATGLPKTETPFTVLNIASRSAKEICLLATRQVAATGSLALKANPATLEKFINEEEQAALGNGTKQHFWNGREFIGVETSLSFGREPAKYVGSFKIKPIGQQQLPPQFVADFEK